MTRKKRSATTAGWQKPAFYPDTGGAGWYAELQFPIKRRLAVMFSPKHQRDVYYRPCELLIPRHERPRIDQVADFFREFRTVSVEYMGDKRGDSLSVIVLFDSPATARDAAEYAASRRARSGGGFLCLVPHVNVSGAHAWTTANIMLVPEQPGRSAQSKDPRSIPARRPKRARTPEVPPQDQPVWDGRYHQSLVEELPSKRPRADSMWNTMRPAVQGVPSSKSTDSPQIHTKSQSIGPTNAISPPSSLTRSLPALNLDQANFSLRHQPDSTPLLTPPQSATNSNPTVQFDRLHNYKNSLPLSTHPSYSTHPLPQWPEWFAVVDGSLVVSLWAATIMAKYPGAEPVHIDDLPDWMKEQMGLEEVRGYRWKVNYKTQERWRANGGFLELPGSFDK